jgi:CheY-like chemotaxis protein
MDGSSIPEETMSMGTILVVDDDAVSRRLIEAALDGEQYETTPARDGLEAWEALAAAPGRFDAVILDRIMPRMQEDPTLAAIPVILQTSLDRKEDILEGFRAGAYYYIPKPLEVDFFLTVVHTAVQYGRMFRGLQEEHRKSMDAMSLLKSGSFRFRTLQEAWFLATLLSNAVEHGNLGVGYDAKSSLCEGDTWLAEITRRLDLPGNRDKIAEVGFERIGEEVRITIRDMGEGFDWKPFLELDPLRVFDDHGRGIALARMHSFDHLEYQGNGNTVVVTIRSSGMS